MINTYLKYLNTPLKSTDNKARSSASPYVIKAFENLHNQVASKLPDIRSQLEENIENIYVGSDLHLSHNNIIKYCDRPFTNADSMNDKLTSNFVNALTSKDLLIIVGDLSMKVPDGSNWFLDKLSCEVIIVAGNHDIHRGTGEVGSFNTLLTCSLLELSLPDGRTLIFSHYPISEKFLPVNSINIHGHIHNNKLYPELGSGKQHRNVSVEMINYTPVKLLSLF